MINDNRENNSLSNRTIDNEYTIIPEIRMSAPTGQWYNKDPSLLADERTAMKMKFPQAVEGKLSDGRMTWTVNLPHIVCTTIDGRQTNPWTFLLAYDADHPSTSTNRNSVYGARWSGSIKVYPVNPTMEDLQRRAARFNRSTIPHTLVDEWGNRYLCTFRPEDFEAGRKSGEKVMSGANAMAQAIKWATAFELGLKDDAVWRKFCSH